MRSPDGERLATPAAWAVGMARGWRFFGELSKTRFRVERAPMPSQTVSRHSETRQPLIVQRRIRRSSRASVIDPFVPDLQLFLGLDQQFERVFQSRLPLPQFC